MEITQSDINDLIKIGEVEKITQSQLESFQRRDFINRQHGDTWRSLMSGKSDTELIAIYKALILLEGELNWIGGSVAAAIWIYKIIQQRNLDVDYELANFGLQNCTNPYIPFGSSYYGPRTILEYMQYSREKAKQKAAKSYKYEKLLERVEGRKQKRSQAIAQLRNLTFEERGQIRKDLMDKYKSASISERFELIANDEKYPPEYYPMEWIDVSKDEILKLPIKLVEALFDKLSTKTKGAWKRFAQNLQEIENFKY